MCLPERPCVGVVGADMFVTNGWSQWGAKVVGAACCARVARAVRQRVASVRTGLSIVYDVFGGRATLDKQTKSHESEQGIEYQQLVTEMIAVEPSLRMAVQHPTE